MLMVTWLVTAFVLSVLHLCILCYFILFNNCKIKLVSVHIISDTVDLFVFLLLFLLYKMFKPVNMM